MNEKSREVCGRLQAGQSDRRVGQGWDLHRLALGRRLVLGGVSIEHDRGLLGHSDADVLVHAVIDALLGAVADDDIGTHFSDDDPRWKDVNSLELLRAVASRLHDRGWTIVNVDSTVIAEAPRLAAYREQMRVNLAQALGIDVDAVSIKAKTAEGLGAEGRQEAISAQAVAMVGRK